MRRRKFLMSYQNRYFNGCEYINYNHIDRYVIKGGKEVFLKREEIKNKSTLGKIEHFLGVQIIFYVDGYIKK